MKTKIYAVCDGCDDFYDIESSDDDGICQGFCSESCEESDRDGSCYCNATDHPPCGYCEGGSDKNHYIIGNTNDIFLWSIFLAYRK